MKNNGTEENKEESAANLETANNSSNEITDDIWTREGLIKESRKFNIDLVPKVCFHGTLKSRLLIFFLVTLCKRGFCGTSHFFQYIEIF